MTVPDGRSARTPEVEYKGWAKYNRHYWLRDYRGFLEFFFAQVFPEPHSTKQIEDCVAWGLDTTPQPLILTMVGGDSGLADTEAVEALCRGIECPAFVVQGTVDRSSRSSEGSRVAELTGAELVRFEGSGHAPHVRDPVRVNLLLRDFAERVTDTPPADALPFSPGCADFRYSASPPFAGACVRLLDVQRRSPERCASERQPTRASTRWRPSPSRGCAAFVPQREACRTSARRRRLGV